MISWLPLLKICVTNDHNYVPLAIVTVPYSFSSLMISTRFVTEVTRRVPLVEQYWVTLAVVQYIFLCVVFCLPLLVFWIFSVCRCIVCSSFDGFRSPFCYPQTVIYIIDCSFLLACLTLSPINVVIIVVYDIKTDIQS